MLVDMVCCIALVVCTKSVHVCDTHLLTNCPSLKEWSQRERKTSHTDVKPIEEGDFINFCLPALLWG